MRSLPGIAAHWSTDEDEGAANLVDWIGRPETKPLGDHPAAAHNLIKSTEHHGDYGTSWSFNGVDAYAELPTPLNTSDNLLPSSNGFSIWVRLADKDTDHSVLANQDSCADANLEFAYNKAQDRWVFSSDGRTTASTPTGTRFRCMSTQPVRHPTCTPQTAVG